MPSTDTTRQAALNAASAAANARLKAEHLDDWNTYMTEEAAERGQEWSPRLTAEQRAEKQFRALLAENPDLASKVLGLPAE